MKLPLEVTALILASILITGAQSEEDDYFGEEDSPWTWTQEEQDLPWNRYALDELTKELDNLAREREDPGYALARKKTRYSRAIELKKKIVETQERNVPRGSFHPSEKFYYFDDIYDDSAFWN